jgi:hypothetical protein
MAVEYEWMIYEWMIYELYRNTVMFTMALASPNANTLFKYMKTDANQ